MHVLWGQMNPFKYWYARSDSKGKKFLKEQNVLRDGAIGLEAPPAIVADDQGNVVVIWHEGAFAKEDERVVWARWSKNHGKTFDKGKSISPKGSGVCACCRLDMALADSGKLYVVFRAAKKRVDRDMILLTSMDFGQTFEEQTFDTWNLSGCPRQAAQIFTGTDGEATILWKNEGETKFASVDALSKPIPLPSADGKRGASMAVNEKGEVLMTWVTGRNRENAGVLNWQVFSADGEPTESAGSQEMAEHQTNPTAQALADGSFAVIY